MKYPDDFLTKMSGASAMGEAQARALRTVDAPYMTKVAGNTITRTKQDFAETQSTGGVPDLFLWYGVGATGLAAAEIDLQGDATYSSVPILRFPRFGTNSASLFTGRAKLVGDGHLTGVAGNTNDVPDQYGTDVVSWPFIFYAPAAIKLRDSQSDEKSPPGVSWLDTLTITGLSAYDHQPEMHATGWDAGTKTYCYSFTAAYPANSEQPYKTRAPVAYYGDLTNKTLTQTAAPFYPGRDNSCFSVFTIGPGTLQALMTVTEDLDFAEMLPPYMATSTDHGRTWVASNADFLAPYLKKVPFQPASGEIPAVREHFAMGESPQLYNMAKYHINVYVGGGKNILIIPNGYTGTEGSVDRYCAMAFIGSEGQGYTRLSWPPDAWVMDQAGMTTQIPESRVLLSFSGRDFLTNQFGFGLGCMYYPTLYEGAARLLVTYDFGSTWALKPLPTLPSDVTGGVIGIMGCVVSPYVDGDDPGELLFTYVRYAAGKISVLRTDGTFTAFKKTGGAIKAKSNQPIRPNGTSLYSPNGEVNRHLTNFAASKKPYIFPAYPGEFDRP